MTLLLKILEICIVPILGALSAFLITLIKTKNLELINRIKQNEGILHQETIEKYLKMAEKTVTDCVIATNQTFVDALKNKEEFTQEACIEAFDKTYNAVRAILAGEAEEYISEAVGDIQVYLTNLIEVAVSENKK